MNCIKDIIDNLHESHVYEMANVSKSDTGLPYTIWIDSESLVRRVGHDSPRLKVEVDGDRIPVSISDNPEILVDKKIVHFSKIKRWIKKYKDVLLQHWNKEITDRQALNLLDK